MSADNDPVTLWEILTQPLNALAVGILAAVAAGYKWVIKAIAAHAKRKELDRRARDFLVGLPPEAKAVLMSFRVSNVHSMRGDPGDPPVRFLTRNNIITVGPGGGSFDAVDSYLTVRADVWRLVKKWDKIDPKDFYQVLEDAERRGYVVRKGVGPESPDRSANG